MWWFGHRHVQRRRLAKGCVVRSFALEMRVTDFLHAQQLQRPFLSDRWHKIWDRELRFEYRMSREAYRSRLAGTAIVLGNWAQTACQMHEVGKLTGLAMQADRLYNSAVLTFHQ